MPGPLVVPGGTADVEEFIVGQLRELRVDESNDSLRLHDGVKEGGYEFLNRDQADARYQAFNAELLGFDFASQEKGFVCRVGPGSYRIRGTTSNAGDLTITNPRGTAGNINFDLSETIATDHTWDGEQTYSERIIAELGLLGPTFGLHTGDVVGNVAGFVTGGGSGTFSGNWNGSVDVRGAEFVTDAGQILETQIDPAAWIRRGVPQGAILMWSGTIDTIPESWALCDGLNGTPDLRERFVKGAGSGIGFSVPGTTGGSATVSLVGLLAVGGSHSHPLAIDDHALTIAELPVHHHGNGVVNGNASFFNHGSIAAVPDTAQHVTEGGAGEPGVEGLTMDTGTGDAHTHTGNTTDSGSHTHDLTLDDAAVIPPYYALCFIMKIE